MNTSQFMARRYWLHDRGGLATIGVGIVVLAFISWLNFSGADEARVTLVSDSVMPVIILYSAIAAWRAARHERLDCAARRAWLCVGFANFAFFVGEVIWFYYEIVRGESPVMSWSDPAYLCTYPLMLCGLLSFPMRDEAGRSRVTFGLDMATVMLGAGMVFWFFLLRPIAIARDASALESTVALAYPVGALVILFGIVAVLMRDPKRDVRAALYVLTAGGVAMLIADMSYAYLTLKDSWVSGGWGDMLYVLAFYTFGFSAHVQQITLPPVEHPADAIDKRPRVFNWLPYVAVALGYGLLLGVTLSHWEDKTFDSLHELIFGATGLAALVVARQIVAVRENLRLQVEHSARREQSRFRALVQNSSDVITILDAELSIAYASPSVAPVFGFTPDEIVNHKLSDFIHPDDAAGALRYFEQALRTPGGSEPREWRLRHKNGSWLHVESVGNNLLDDADIKGFVVNSRDVSDRKRIEEQLRYDAFHDALTGLPNRAMFVEHLRLTLERANRSNDHRFAVLFIDLDRFKYINDSLGHAAGDALLIHVARRLERGVRPGDTIARLGGDEFAVLVGNVGDADEAAHVAERIQKQLSAPITLEGHETLTTASIGIALGADIYESAADMLRDADTAMYHSKMKGVARHELFDRAMRQRVCDMVELEADLRRAVERAEFFLVYQPIVRLDDATPVGFEALVRWQHPKRGLIPPGDFIQLAEETNLILPIGRWVLHEACRQMRAWQQLGLASEAMTISVNISSKQFVQPDIVEQISCVLHETRLPARNLKIEVTESVVMDDTERMTDQLKRLRALDVSLSLDDFGTGYSSLSYLHRFPLSTLKIDRSFVSRLDEQDEHEEIVRTIVTLASSLGMDTIAEGVETEAQRARLRSFGCEYAQGYLFSKPLAAAAAHDLLARAAPLDRAAAEQLSEHARVDTASSALH